MTVFEILNFNKELLKKMRAIGIRLEDAYYIELYKEYLVMLAGGNKVSYIVAMLADKYSVSERKVYGLIIQRLNSPFSVRIPFFSIARTVAPS